MTGLLIKSINLFSSVLVVETDVWKVCFVSSAVLTLVKASQDFLVVLYAEIII